MYMVLASFGELIGLDCTGLNSDNGMDASFSLALSFTSLVPLLCSNCHVLENSASNVLVFHIPQSAVFL